MRQGHEAFAGHLPAARSARRETRSDAGPRLAPWQEHLAKELMRKRLAEPVSISDVACACRLSLSYFIRAFANTVGTAPYDWFLGQRIARAQELLAHTVSPLAEIALECGFVDQSHFTNTFGRRVGTTPLRWRREAWVVRSLPRVAYST